MKQEDFIEQYDLADYNGPLVPLCDLSEMQEHFGIFVEGD